MKAFAFDCFGTVFDMQWCSKEEIRAYVNHVKREDFSPFPFPRSWFALGAHPDSAEGIRRLQAAGFKCVTLSNGSFDLLEHISVANGIAWDTIIDLVKHKAYKPRNLDAYRAVQIETGIAPGDTCMVTANPTFGDVESSAAVGMHCQVIRHPGCPQTIIELAEKFGC